MTDCAVLRIDKKAMMERFIGNTSFQPVRGQFMLRAKENEEFDKWWRHWIANVAQSRMAVKHPPSGIKSGDDAERSGRSGAVLDIPCPY